MKLIFLDRDGVINQDSPDFVKSPEEWRPIPGSLQAIARLHRAGWKVIVTTNQSGVARKLLDEKALAAIHTRMHREVQQAGGWIDDLIYCPHGPDDGCTCRKPKPGLLHQAARKWHVDISGAPCIGDSLRDLEAAAASGCKPILVLTGNGKKTKDQANLPRGTQVFSDLAQAAEALLGA